MFVLHYGDNLYYIYHAARATLKQLDAVYLCFSLQDISIVLITVDCRKQ